MRDLQGQPGGNVANVRAATRKHTPSTFGAPSDITLLPQLEGEIQVDAELAASTTALPKPEGSCSEDERAPDDMQDSSSDEHFQATPSAGQGDDASTVARSPLGLSLPCGNQGCSVPECLGPCQARVGPSQVRQARQARPQLQFFLHFPLQGHTL